MLNIIMIATMTDNRTAPYAALPLRLAPLLGLWARIAAIALIPILLGAIATVHAHAGFFFTDPGGGWEFPGLWVVALLALALTGDGALAIRPTPTPGGAVIS